MDGQRLSSKCLFNVATRSVHRAEGQAGEGAGGRADLALARVVKNLLVGRLVHGLVRTHLPQVALLLPLQPAITPARA
jgi:hypothetical protein